MPDLADRIAAAAGVRPTGLEELEGGLIGTVYRADLADGRTLAAKVGDTPLSVEADMLSYLDEHTALPVPAVHHASDDLLLMEYVSGDGAVTPAVERDAADHLAALHTTSADAFGFERDTLSGPLRQPNPWTDSWVAFYRDERLLHVARIAREAGTLSSRRHERVRAVAADLGDLLPEPEPALVHGDVWPGNLIVGDGAVRAFLDPAIYFGHAEVELAYVEFTDAFGEAFFERYRERRGIDPGYETRRDVYALYPLLEHVHILGRYGDRLDATLSRLGY